MTDYRKHLSKALRSCSLSLFQPAKTSKLRHERPELHMNWRWLQKSHNDWRYLTNLTNLQATDATVPEYSIAIGVNVVSEWLEDQAVQCIASTAVGKPCLGQEMSYCTSPGRCLANLLFREDAKFHATWTHIAAIVLILRFSTETLAKSNASEMDHGMKTWFDQYAPYPRKFQCCAWALRLAIRIGGRTNQALNERKL